MIPGGDKANKRVDAHTCHALPCPANVNHVPRPRRRAFSELDKLQRPQLLNTLGGVARDRRVASLTLVDQLSKCQFGVGRLLSVPGRGVDWDADPRNGVDDSLHLGGEFQVGDVGDDVRWWLRR